MTGPARAVLALDLGGTKLAAAVVEESGVLRRRRSEATRAEEGAEDVLRRAVALAGSVLAEELGDGGPVGALGVATMGITREHGTELAPNVAGWDRLAIPEALRQAFPDLEITIGNDVRAATLAELRWGALKGAQTGVYLNLGTGVMAGFVVDGRVPEGAHGAAGEIGYWLLEGWQDAKLAAEGGAPAEERLGGRAIARRASGLFGEPLDLPGLVALAERRSEAAALLEELWGEIALLAANLAIALDPEVLVLGGGYVRSGSSLLGRVAALVGRAVPYPPQVELSRYGSDASLYGAGALGLGAARFRGAEALGRGARADGGRSAG